MEILSSYILSSRMKIVNSNVTGMFLMDRRITWLKLEEDKNVMSWIYFSFVFTRCFSGVAILVISGFISYIHNG